MNEFERLDLTEVESTTTEPKEDKEFEEAKQELLDFLNTPHYDYIREHSEKGGAQDNPDFIFTFIKEKVEKIIVGSQDKSKCFDFFIKLQYLRTLKK